MTATAPGMRLLAAPGHSPGQLAVELGEAKPVALYLADVVVHELHLRRFSVPVPGRLSARGR